MRLTLLIVPFSLLFVVGLVASAVLAFDTARRVQDRWLERLYVAATVTFLMIAMLMGYTFVVGGRHRWGGELLETLSMLSSIVPSALFGYFVYRHRVLGYRLRERFVSLFVLATVAAVYLFGVRQLAQRAELLLKVPAVLVEAAALLTLLLVFEPASREFRVFVRRVFGGEGERVQRATQRAGELFRGAGTPAEIETALVETLGDELELTAVRLIPAGTHGGELSLRAPALAGLLGNQALVTESGVSDPVVSAELAGLEAVAAFALRTHSGLVGALTLGRQPSGASIPLVYLERLRPLADATALALENAALVEDRLELVKQASRSERLASLGYMAASVVHEVKNPLSSIKAVAQVMRAEAERGAEQARSGSHRRGGQSAQRLGQPSARPRAPRAG